MPEIKKRLLVFAVATSAVLIVLFLWRPPKTGESPVDRTVDGISMLPPQAQRLETWGSSPNVIADAWFGPLLVMSYRRCSRG